MVFQLLREHPELELLEDYHFPYEQWQGGGPEPLKVEPFLIVPPWRSIEPDNGNIRILLDPGVVFGNGLHPTTRDCLRALVWLRKRHAFQRVLDLGTGTGILSLAAARLDAEKVLAVDLNPLCVKTARQNVELNLLEGAVEVAEGRAQDFVEEPADLMIANIHDEVLAGLIASEGIEKKPRLILSGLMRSQAGEIKSQTERQGFRLLREWDHEMTWFTLLFVNERPVIC
jgi:ribosomal protein L11 methyltransferase